MKKPPSREVSRTARHRGKERNARLPHLLPKREPRMRVRRTRRGSTATSLADIHIPPLLRGRVSVDTKQSQVNLRKLKGVLREEREKKKRETSAYHSVR